MDTRASGASFEAGSERERERERTRRKQRDCLGSREHAAFISEKSGLKCHFQSLRRLTERLAKRKIGVKTSPVEKLFNF